MVAIPEIQRTTVNAIWDALENDQENWDSYGVSISQANDPCARKLWYGLRWLLEPEKFPGRTLAIFDSGNYHEQKTIDQLRLAGLEVVEFDPDTGKQFKVALARGFLRGKIDAKVRGFVEAPKTWHIVEIKSAKNTDFNAVRKHGVQKAKPEHYGQNILYMLAEGAERGAYIVTCKNTDDKEIQRLRLEDVREDAEFIVRRVEEIVDAEEPPAKLQEDGDKFPCGFCRFNGLCHGGEFPKRRTCRTCIHFTFTEGGNGHCDRWHAPKTPNEQKLGCVNHLFLPSIIPAEQTDANAELETISYKLVDGRTWTDGGRDEQAH
jgi:CRISPR/Cas system-associated exonuclease Cas4 (RecB family)